MKRKRIIFLLAAAFAIAACAAGCGTKNKGETQHAENTSVFPISSEEDGLSVSMGDVMPFYDDGVMNIFHLSDISDSTLYYHPISLITTSDYVHYNDEGVVINYEEKPDSVDSALGTGSVIKDKQGKYHFFYTGHNDGWEKQGLPHTECLRHATSTDKKNWEKDEDFKRYGYENDFRDPYVYYDESSSLYYMLVTTRHYGEAVIKRFSSPSLDAKDSEWQDMGMFFVNKAGSYNMECPSYIEYNGYYYLAFSEQGDNRVTHYWYRNTPAGEFKEGEWTYGGSIDDTGFYAGRLEKDADGLYAFAWCARLTGGNTGKFDWGGNMVVHKLEQKPDGKLCAVMTSQVKDEVSDKIDYKLSNGETFSSLSYDGEGFAANGVERFGSSLIRMSFDVTFNDKSGDCGITFGLKKPFDGRLGNRLIAFDPVNNKIRCHSDVSNILRYGFVLSEVDFDFATDAKYSVDLIIHGEVLTLYMNGEVALTGRFTGIEKKCCAFYSNGASVTFGEICIYE